MTKTKKNPHPTARWALTFCSSVTLDTYFLASNLLFRFTHASTKGCDWEQSSANITGWFLFNSHGLQRLCCSLPCSQWVISCFWQISRAHPSLLYQLVLSASATNTCEEQTVMWLTHLTRSLSLSLSLSQCNGVHGSCIERSTFMTIDTDGTIVQRGGV